MTWKEAIIEVLQRSSEPMHYADIAEAAVEQGLVDRAGATPARTANAAIVMSIQNEGDNSPFFRVSRGVFALKRLMQEPPQVPVQIEEDAGVGDTGLINAFGMYWNRNDVLWSTRPRILGKQQPGSTLVDFYDEKGVYLLHDGRAVVYVGRTTERPLGVRLKEHTVDRLKGRWDRFTWFGVYPVTDAGTLNTAAATDYTLSMLIVTMEALLIEGLEPPQNRKKGDDFKAVEFMQVEDPEIQKKQIIQLMDELKSRLG